MSAVGADAPADGATPIVPMTPVARAIDLGATPLAVDDGGIPRLLRGNADAPAMPAVDAASTARLHVERLAPVWGVRAGAMPTLEPVGELPMLGGTIVRFRQVIDGLPIDSSSGGELRVMVKNGGALLAASGKLMAADAPHPKAPRFVDDDAGAIARAVRDLYQTSFAPTTLAMKSLGSDGSRMLAGGASQVNVSLARARQAWYPDGKALTPAWIVEAYSSNVNTTDGDAYRTVISADGRVLARTNLKADVAFNYRVFAETTGEFTPLEGPLVDLTPHPMGVPDSVPYPAYVTPNLVSVEGLNHPGGSATPDPWLAANRTETFGNNVDAYTDINAPDSLTFGDFRATVTATRTFDRSYDTSASALSSQDQQMAGTTSLFYLVNWLHDFWYDAGFTEATGNGQNLNFGRGGEDRDAINVEAQDNANGGSRNNANMTTPSDGLPPRMQVFVWNGKEKERTLAISNRNPLVTSASFGPGTFDITGDVVLANDGVDTVADDGIDATRDACEPLPAAEVTGKVVLVDRGTCSFKTKALNVQTAGGIGMLLADNADSVEPPGMPNDATIPTVITIGMLSVLKSEGELIRADLAAGPVTATLHRVSDPELEGTLDASVIAHEFGHYLHHRLSVCNTRLCGAMSEGWGDFVALLVGTRAGDNLNGAFPVGVYSTQSFAADPLYFGIRRAPYSVSQTINSLSFRHMADGESLPTNHPFDSGGVNSEVHNAGEVWASMMWEGYVALQQQPGAVFEEVRNKMREYVVAGLLLAPTDATPTETRDAILAAALAASPADHDVLAAAYARRGFGSCAVSPPRNSTNFIGITDSSEVKGRLAPGAIATQTMTRCDYDDVLDAGELARVTVPVANPGAAGLSDVTVTLSSTTPGIRVTNPTVQIGTIARYGQATATFNVALDDSVADAVAGEFTVEFASANGCETTLAIPLPIRLNTDDEPQSSATDTFDAGSSVWTPDGDAALWAHNRETALDGLWVGTDSGEQSDASLISPPLTAGTGPVSVTFTHRFSFEFAPASGTNPDRPFDGGVIEYSTDDGTTWQDVSMISMPTYNQTLVTGTNPLAGRMAYGSTNPSHPNFDNVTLDFGTKLSGKTFQLRFRIGTDTNTGAPGWEIDNVAFTGIVGTPFPTLVTDSAICNAAAPPETGDGGCQTGGPGTGSAGLALGVLAVLLRRRRR
jgi:MYXO-CTERM domain-containing protein